MASAFNATDNRPRLKNITDFKNKLRGGGARPNLFEVAIPAFPTNIQQYWTTADQDDFRFLCKSAALPASNVAPIDVPFRGRILKVAGDRTFDTWTVTIINDEDFNLRHAFEQWMNHISKLDNASGAVNPQSYMTDAIVWQLGRSNQRNGTNVVDGNADLGQAAPPYDGGTFQSRILRAYKLHDIFPTNVSQIDLSYDTGDTIEEFTVEFQVNWFEIDDQEGGEVAGSQAPNDNVI